MICSCVESNGTTVHTLRPGISNLRDASFGPTRSARPIANCINASTGDELWHLRSNLLTSQAPALHHTPTTTHYQQKWRTEQYHSVLRTVWRHKAIARIVTSEQEKINDLSGITLSSSAQRHCVVIRNHICFNMRVARFCTECSRTLQLAQTR